MKKKRIRQFGSRCVHALLHQKAGVESMPDSVHETTVRLSVVRITDCPDSPSYMVRAAIESVDGVEIPESVQDCGSVLGVPCGFFSSSTSEDESVERVRNDEAAAHVWVNVKSMMSAIRALNAAEEIRDKVLRSSKMFSGDRG